MPTASLLETLVAFGAFGVIALICRWVFTPTHTPQRRPAGPPDYGLLRPVTTAPTRADALALREVLVSAGIRASVGQAGEVLVFSADLERARELVG